VINPAIGDTPEVIAAPMHNGNATRKTTTESSASLHIVALKL
jgi:hypothetical protein